MMDAFESRLFQGLAMRLQREIEDRTVALASGSAQSFEAYKKMVGEIAGMNTALALAHQVEDDARGVKRED